MDPVEAIVWWGLIALGGLALAGVLAGVKNRDVSFWMGWCFLLPPLVLFLFLLPRRAGRGPARPSSTIPIKLVGDDACHLSRRTWRLQLLEAAISILAYSPWYLPRSCVVGLASPFAA